jgi:hypothetical protein
MDIRLLKHTPVNAEDALASLNFAPEVFNNSDVEKSGHYFTYDEPEFPMPTFHSTTSGIAPVRGPPPVYEKPFQASSPVPF